MRGVVTGYLRRTPTRAEMNAARRAAHGLVASGHATVLRLKPTGADAGPGGENLIIALLGTTSLRRLLDQLASDAARSADIDHFDPTAMAEDLARSVELFSAAVQAISVDHLDPAAGDRLAASVDASLKDLRRIRRRFRSQ